MNQHKKILVTGGAGFIGSHLIDSLISKGYKVIVLDNLCQQIHPSQTLPKYYNRKAQFILGDVTNKDAWTKALVGVDAIYHLAAAVGVGQSMYEIEHYVKVNSYGTALLLDILANKKHKVKKIIIAASMSSYGEGSYKCNDCGIIQPPLRHESKLSKKDFTVYCQYCGQKVSPIATKEDVKQNSNSIYAISKKNQEEMIINFGISYSIPTVALRYFNVYGTRQSLSNPYNGVVAIFISRVKNDKAPLINEDGLQTRDFIHIKDVTEANVKVLESDKANYQIFNIGSGQMVSIGTVAEIIINLFHKKIKPDITNKVRKLDVRHCFADIDKIRSYLGWRPTVQFTDGLKEVILWSLSERAVDKVDLAMEQLEKRGLR